MRLLIVMLLLLLTGCETILPTPKQPMVPSILLDSVDKGTVMNASVVPTNWNKQPKTRIETTTSVIIVYGLISVTKGVGAWENIHGDGARYFCMKDAVFCHPVY